MFRQIRKETFFKHLQRAKRVIIIRLTDFGGAWLESLYAPRSLGKQLFIEDYGPGGHFYDDIHVTLTRDGYRVVEPFTGTVFDVVILDRRWPPGGGKAIRCGRRSAPPKGG
jgi:hypothetical protein